jgi:glycosyltransferase involved in cell wall biosynthesis
MITIMHVVDLASSNPWLNGVAAHHDRARFRTLVTSIGPRNGLHEALEQRDVRSFALNAGSRRQMPVAALKLRKLLRQERVDIVQTHLFDPSTIGLLAAAAARTPLKIVTRHHSDFTTLFRRPIHRRIDRLHAMNADRVMAASEAVKRSMVRYEGVPAEKITVARYGYDFTGLRPRLTPDRRRALREAVAGDDRLLIGTVARLSMEKGHEYLFEAIPEVARQFPDVCFVLVGTGPLDQQLRATVERRRIASHVKFLGWRSDAWDLIEAMDLMVHPTLHEAFCSVIIESLALERPLVATNVAAAPEQIDDTETGLLVPPRDPEAIATAIMQLLADRERAAEMGREARRRVNERLNFPRMMREYETCYLEWFDGKPTAPADRASGQWASP